MLTKFRTLIKKNLLLAFFLIAFGYSWVFNALIAWLAPDRSSDLAIYLPSIYGPTISAILICLVLGGPRKLAEFLKRSLSWKAGISWYLVSLLGIPLLLLVIRTIHKLLFPELIIDPIQLPKPVTAILTGYLMSLTFGPFGEELGWRGFALPLLQKRINALVSSLILGVIWWAWHLPQLLIPELKWAVGGMPPFIFLLTILPGSVIAAWVYNNSGGSTLLTILFHGSMNFSMGLLGFNSPHFIPMMIAGLSIAAVIITLVYGADRLSRKEVDLADHPLENIQANGG